MALFSRALPGECGQGKGEPHRLSGNFPRIVPAWAVITVELLNLCLHTPTLPWSLKFNLRFDDFKFGAFLAVEWNHHAFGCLLQLLPAASERWQLMAKLQTSPGSAVSAYARPQIRTGTGIQSLKNT
jgi:hypothetical protein